MYRISIQNLFLSFFISKYSWNYRN